jgi:hypothetical protein
VARYFRQRIISPWPEEISIEEARLFAEEIFGRTIPPVPPAQDQARARREQSQRPAAILTRAEQQLRERERVRALVRGDRRLLDFLADIKVEYEDLRNSVLGEEAEARAAQRGERYADGRPAHEAWDSAKHPRTGAPPNAGWFASTGAGQHAHGGGMFNVAADRSITKISRASGKNWSGDQVLDVLKTVAPGWLPFIKQHVTLARNSSGESKESTTVRIGENGPEVDTAPGAMNDPGHKTVHFHVPDDWNDLEVARYILTQLADHSDAHRMAAQWATDKPKLFDELRSDRFKNGLKTIAELAKGYYTALAGLAPGGGAAVAVWDLQQGDTLGAALGVAFMLPLGKIGRSALDATGGIAIKQGNKVIAALPTSVLQKVAKLADDQRTLLSKRLLAAKTQGEVASIVDTFLGTAFDRHHPLPMFLGGDSKQALARIPKSVHDEFHAELRRELRAGGFNLPIGTKAGSTEKWLQHFEDNPGAQGRAFDAVLNASRAIDSKHGTEIASSVWKNLVGSNLKFFP